MHTDTLNQTVNEIFEKMYFMFPEQLSKPDSHFSLPINCYVARSSFVKEKGTTILYAENNLVNQMAENFLGEKRPFEHLELIDIMREAANVIVGNYITATNKPPEVSFEIPVVDTTTMISWDKDSLYYIDCIYDIENYFFRIALAR
jgi:hypothetical protein